MKKQKLVTCNSNEGITSLEIAKTAGKQHKNVLRDIREMETAWDRINGLKFELIDYVDERGRKKPCYLLTLEQMLYVITKYSNETRAKLVMRWSELEQREHLRMQKALVEAEGDARYCREVLASHGTPTTTDIAKSLGLTARALNRILHEMGIIYQLPRKKTWCLYAPYDKMGLIEYEVRTYYRKDGRAYTKQIQHWSEKGRRLISEKVGNYSNFRPMDVMPRYVELTIAFPVN